jgi:hypothetical protein
VHDGTSGVFGDKAYVEQLTRADQLGRTDYILYRESSAAAENVLESSTELLSSPDNVDITLPSWAHHMTATPADQSVNEAVLASLRGSSAVHDFEVIAFGWPFRALKYDVAGSSVIVTRGQQRMHKASPVFGGRRVAWIEPWRHPATGAQTYPRTVPLTPIWPGLLANTIFYAALCAGVLFMLKLRRTLRARQGRCAQCGYVLHGLTRCPECGAIGSPHSVQRSDALAG